MSMHRLMILALAGAACAPAAAQVPAVEFDNPVNTSFGSFVLGYSFSVNDDILVTHLGAFDESRDGLIADYAVGIWDINGNLLMSGTVLQNDPLTGHFRYTDNFNVHITDQLLAGNTYVVGADVLEYSWNPQNFQQAPEISYIEARYTSGGSLQYPNTNDPNSIGYFGGNFMFIPAPGAAALMGLGGLAIARRRR